MKSVRFNLWLLLLPALLALTPGCSSFSRHWKEASAKSLPVDGIEGRWEGTWQSEENGHTGPLRCIVSRKGEKVFEARYHAKYKRVFTFSFSYTAALRAARHQQEYRFVGEADLGWLAGGVYRYTGQATPDRFFSTYQSEHDHGTFTLTRPESPNTTASK